MSTQYTSLQQSGTTPVFDVQQVMTQAMVYVMSISIMSTAMGVAMASMGPELLTKPTEAKGKKKAVEDLKITFGADIVTQAVKNAGDSDILSLCKEIEKLYIAQMREKYGTYAADTALKAAPPGDIKTANEIAISLSNRGYGKFAQQVIPAPTGVEASAIRTGTLKGRRKAKPQKDTTTGIMYKSQAAAGMAVAAEYGLDATETFIWYEVIKKAPNRFVRVTPEQYEAYKKEHGG